MGKNIVICTDGTWNRPDQMDRGRMVPSNVVKICRALADRDHNGVEQRYYYDPGVGTGQGADRLLGGAFGIGLSKNILQAYKWLATVYEAGDNIFLFGFSRGAFTARSLGGLVGRCGILKVPQEEVDQKTDEAFKIYRMKRGEKRDARAAAFREENAHPSDEIWFIGVWDTVGALGVPLKALNWIGSWRHKFHDVSLCANVRNAYHAVAIDEQRRPFRPTLWQTDSLDPGQTVVQAWFPGVHSNIGGGYADTGLSDRALYWMIAHAAENGLRFEDEYLAHRIDPNYHGELRRSLSRVYKVFGRIRRPIGEGNAVGEAIHFSARRRSLHPTNDYRPDNLVAALDREDLAVTEPLQIERAVRRAPPSGSAAEIDRVAARSGA